MSGEMKSTPAIVTPIARAARTAANALSGWMMSITSTCGSARGDIGGGLDAYDTSGIGNACARISLTRQDTVAVLVQIDRRHGLAADAPRIAVFDLDEFRDVMTPIARHRRRNTARRRDELPGNDKQTVIVAGKQALQHVWPLVNARQRKRRVQFRFVTQIDVDGIALHAVDGFQDQRVADPFRDARRGGSVIDHGEPAHRKPQIVQRRQRHNLVRCIVAGERQFRIEKRVPEIGADGDLGRAGHDACGRLCGAKEFPGALRPRPSRAFLAGAPGLYLVCARPQHLRHAFWVQVRLSDAVDDLYRERQTAIGEEGIPAGEEDQRRALCAVGCGHAARRSRHVAEALNLLRNASHQLGSTDGV